MKTPTLAALPKSPVAGRILGLVVLLTTALTSGAVIGIANAAGSPEPKTSVQALAAQATGSDGFESSLSVNEPPATTPQQQAAAAEVAKQQATVSRSSGRGVAAPVLNLVIPGMSGSGAGGSGGGSSVKCSRFDDPKIQWLLDQVAKTKAEHPELSTGADRMSAELRSALGKNMCASEAQVLINRLCDDPAVVKVMNQMVSQLPFFIKPMIGNPCTADLVSVLNKAGKFVPGLSSDPS